MTNKMKVTCMVTFRWESEDPSKEGTIGDIAGRFEDEILVALGLMSNLHDKTISVETDYVGLDIDMEAL